MTEHNSFDVIIIGGSYAGLSAAMALGRSRRKTLIIDAGKPCNESTPHSQNFLTQDGKAPKEIAALAKQQVEAYPTVQFYTDLAISGKQVNGGFEIATQSGKVVFGKKLIFASGIKDKIPAIKGFAECWGISVIHCPYCHGYEYRDQKTAILANRDKAMHMASLVNNLTKDVTVLTSGYADFTEIQLEKLKKNNIEIVETEVTEIEHEKGYVKQVIFKDGTKMDFTAVYAPLPFEQHSGIPVELGCEINAQGHIEIDGFQRTSIPGVFACGDNSNPMRSVANAVFTGNATGAFVNKTLVDEQFFS